MKSIIESAFFKLLNSAFAENISIPRAELKSAYEEFRETIVSKLESQNDFAASFRIIGSAQIELCALRDGIVGPSCEAGKKCTARFGIY